MNLINIKDLPVNVRKILEYVATGNLFKYLNPFGRWYLFEDGDDVIQEKKEDKMEQINLDSDKAA